jgi:hypothetical protein
MVRRGVLGWILTAVLLGGVCLIAASAQAQAVENGNGLEGGSPLAPTPQAPGPEAPVTIGASLWYEFSFTSAGVPATSCPGCTNSVGNVQGAPAAPWTFTAPPQGAILTVTDRLLRGDVFNVFDFGFPIGSTTVVAASGSCTDDPTVCVADPLSSHGFFFLGPGNHSITIVPTSGPGFGGAYFRVDTAAQLFNISTRGQVGTGANVLIAGFIITGNSPALVLVRAIGPSLTALMVPGALSDPTVTLFSGPTPIAFNDDWQDPVDPLCASSGHICGGPASIAATFPPSDFLESAILIILDPGLYTAIVSGFGGLTGVGLVEVFEVPLF